MMGLMHSLKVKEIFRLSVCKEEKGVFAKFFSVGCSEVLAHKVEICTQILDVTL